jgi:hypothetical protein
VRIRKTQTFDLTTHKQDQNRAGHEDKLPNHKPKTELLDQAQAEPGIAHRMRKSTQRSTAADQAETEGMTGNRTKIGSATEDWAPETKNRSKDWCTPLPARAGNRPGPRTRCALNGKRVWWLGLGRTHGKLTHRKLNQGIAGLRGSTTRKSAGENEVDACAAENETWQKTEREGKSHRKEEPGANPDTGTRRRTKKIQREIKTKKRPAPGKRKK